MSTIAYRDGSIAGDTLCCSGWVRSGRVEAKITRGPSGVLAGAVGSATFAEKLLRWARLGRQGDPPKGEDTADRCDRGVVIEADGRITVYEGDGSFTLDAPFFAMGSGRELALGAMAMGASAERAIEVASRLDVYTGSEIQALRHQTEEDGA